MLYIATGLYTRHTSGFVFSVKKSNFHCSRLVGSSVGERRCFSCPFRSMHFNACRAVVTVELRYLRQKAGTSRRFSLVWRAPVNPCKYFFRDFSALTRTSKAQMLSRVEEPGSNTRWRHPVCVTRGLINHMRENYFCSVYKVSLFVGMNWQL